MHGEEMLSMTRLKTLILHSNQSVQLKEEQKETISSPPDKSKQSESKADKRRHSPGRRSEASWSNLELWFDSTAAHE